MVEEDRWDAGVHVTVSAALGCPVVIGTGEDDEEQEEIIGHARGT
jgi:hypothetical protein